MKKPELFDSLDNLDNESQRVSPIYQIFIFQFKLLDTGFSLHVSGN